MIHEVLQRFRKLDKPAGDFAKQHKTGARILADSLPVFRGISGPVLAWELMNTPPKDRTWGLCSQVLTIELTDLIDGWVARHIGESDYGGWLDQMADKAFVLPVVLALGLNGEIPMHHFLIKSGRDVSVSYIRKEASKHGVNVKAQDLGKIKAWAEFAGIAMAASPIAHKHPDLIKETFAIASGLNLVSGMDYYKKFKKATKKTPLSGLAELASEKIVEN